MDVREIRLRVEMMKRDNHPKPHVILLTHEQMQTLKADLIHHVMEDPYNDRVEIFGITITTPNRIVTI